MPVMSKAKIELKPSKTNSRLSPISGIQEIKRVYWICPLINGIPRKKKINAPRFINPSNIGLRSLSHLGKTKIARDEKR